jgi:hypothetical protein
VNGSWPVQKPHTGELVREETPGVSVSFRPVIRRRAGAIVAARHACARRRWRRKLTGVSVSRSGGRGPVAKTRERRQSPGQSWLVDLSDPTRKSYSGVGRSHGTAGSRGQTQEPRPKPLIRRTDGSRDEETRGGSEAKRQVGWRRLKARSPGNRSNTANGVRKSQERRRDRRVPARSR